MIIVQLILRIESMSIRKTEKLVLAIILASCSISLWSQTQSGYVKTIGRPGRAGEPLGGVSVRASGGHNSALSDSSGCFFLTMAGKKNGDPYSIQQVFKSGYELNDYEVIGRQLAFSDRVPLNIVMVSSRQLQEDKQRIINNAYRVAEENYKARAAELERQNKESLITIETYREQLQALQSGFDKYQTLIESLADRYAHTDYDMLDEAEREINLCIEAGDLGRADSLIRTAFNPVGVLERNRDALSRLDDQISQAGEMLADAKSEMTELLKRQEKDAEYLYRLYTIALLRFETDDAARYLITRAELDTTNVEWQAEAGTFIYRYMANYDATMQYYHRALHNSMQKHGKYHKDIAAIYNNIGIIYNERANYDTALKYYKLSLDIITSLEEDNIPLESTIYNNIGTVYYYKNEIDKALSYLFKAYNLRKDFYGPTHRLIGESLTNIGRLYQEQGRIAEAIECHLSALEIILKITEGAPDYDAALCYQNLGLAYLSCSKYDEALSNYKKAIEIQKKIFYESHPDIGLSYYNLGKVCCNQGNYEIALRYLLKAADIQKSAFGNSHPSLAESYNAIGEVYGKLHEYNLAFEYFLQGIKILDIFYPDNEYVQQGYETIVSVYQKFGNASIREKDYDSALHNYIKAYQICSEYRVCDSSLPKICNQIGKIYYYQKEYGDAVDYYMKAIYSAESLNKTDNKSLVTIYENLASAYYSMDQYDKTMFYFKKALDILLELPHKDYLRIADLYQAIGSIYFNRKNYKNALANLKEAETLYEKYDNDNEKLVYCRETIDVINSSGIL